MQNLKEFFRKIVFSSFIAIINSIRTSYKMNFSPHMKRSYKNCFLFIIKFGQNKKALQEHFTERFPFFIFLGTRTPSKPFVLSDNSHIIDCVQSNCITTGFLCNIRNHWVQKNQSCKINRTDFVFQRKSGKKAEQGNYCIFCINDSSGIKIVLVPGYKNKLPRSKR